MLNHIVIMGRLTRDPELRRTASGVAVASFTLAVDRDYSGKDGGEKETDFIDCVAWRQTGEFVSKYFTKGRMAVASGRLQVRKWKNKDGENRYSTEVLADHVYFGDSKKEETNTTGGGYGNPNAGYGNPTGGGYGNTYGGGGYPGTQYSAPGYSAPGYAPPEYPASDFAMLEDDDGQLPF